MYFLVWLLGKKGRARVEPATYRAATDCSTTELTPHVGDKKVLPGFEPGLQGSKPWVLTNYTIEP